MTESITTRKNHLDLFDKILNTESVIKNADILTNYTVPEYIQFRDNEIEKLFRIYKPIITTHGQYALNTLVHGKSGIGKTITVKYFLKKFQEQAKKTNLDIIVDYFDCVQFRTKSSIMRHISNRFFPSDTCHGYSDFEITKSVVQILQKKNKYLFIILDEIQALTQDDLFSLLNSQIAFGSIQLFSIILITRTNQWMKYSNELLQSRIQEMVEFSVYNRDQLQYLLQNKINSAFTSNIIINDNVLNYLVNIIYESENLRYGIEILRNIGYELDKTKTKEITIDFINQFKVQISPTFRYESIDSLKGHEKTVLYSIVQYFIEFKTDFTDVESAYSKYIEICKKQGFEKIVTVSYRKCLQNLRDNNAIECLYISPTKIKKGRRLKILAKKGVNYSHVNELLIKLLEIE